MGNSFVEAMSMKMPVIATTEGGLSDFIYDEKTAFVCLKDSPESIVNAVYKIETFRNNRKLDIILTEAYEMILEKYNWDKVSKDMEIQVFSEIK